MVGGNYAKNSILHFTVKNASSMKIAMQGVGAIKTIKVACGDYKCRAGCDSTFKAIIQAVHLEVIMQEKEKILVMLMGT